MTEIPKPDETGSSGTQETSETDLVSTTPESPLEGLPIERAVGGLAATRSRSMGGEVAANLIAGSFSQISYDLKEVKEDLRHTRDELKSARDELSNCKEKAAVLTERVRSNSRSRHLRNLSMTAGTALLGIAIEFSRNDFDNISYITGGLGVLLILLGWFSVNGEAKK